MVEAQNLAIQGREQFRVAGFGKGKACPVFSVSFFRFGGRLLDCLEVIGIQVRKCLDNKGTIIVFIESH